MPEGEHPAARYRRLASQCLEVANTFPPSEQRTAPATHGASLAAIADDYE